MIKKLLYILGLLLAGYSSAQQCPGPLLVAPLNGAVDVPVDTDIRWNGVTGVPAYLISLGTTPFGTDILNRQNVGNANSYIPPLGLPGDTEVFVTITLFFFQPEIPEIVCTSESFRTRAITAPPPCTSLSSPTAGSVNVNLASDIFWTAASTANSYDLILESVVGSGNIFSGNVGNRLSYDPGDLPASTEIFVTIIPRNDVGMAVGCVRQSFTTGMAASLPDCTSLLSPANGATNVPLSPLLEWPTVPGATGYRVTIGLSPTSAEILNNDIFFSNSTFVIEFEPNRTFFVRIVPFNDAGEAIGCTQESFSTLLGCGPYFDPVSGDLVSINPDIVFPDTVALCENEPGLNLTAPDSADGFRWYRVDPSGIETLLAEGPNVELVETGQYRYEAYNLVSQSGNSIECSSTKLFEVTSSERPQITSLGLSRQSDLWQIEVRVTGNGDYEFALDNMEGPYQDSPVFENVPQGSHTLYVRDKKGCGIASQDIKQEVALDGFPRFFTPNGDGINDYWQFIPPTTLDQLNLNTIQVYDRYGRLIARIDPSSEGWDGTFKGKPVPSDDYWFRAELEEQGDLRGHFALKR